MADCDGSVEDCVAPHAGAWIETHAQLFQRLEPTSHPMRVRGLKRCSTLRPRTSLHVAPHAGAWIETYFPEVA